MKPPMEKVAANFLRLFSGLFNQVRENPPPDWTSDEGAAVMLGTVQAMVEIALAAKTPEDRALAEKAFAYIKESVTVTAPPSAPTPKGPAS